MPSPTVVVVGAGAAGLSAARRLSAAGAAVTVVDKGRGVGGRLATRRMGGARIDHGAQFFTVRDGGFAGLVDRWLADGAAREWCRGFGEHADGHPRYVGDRGMTSLAKHLADGLHVRVGTRLDPLTTEGGRLVARSDGGEVVARADAAVLTPPVPQSVGLLAGVALAPGAADALGRIAYSPTVAVLAVLDRPAALPPPGGRQLDGGPLSWVGDNMAKGISEVPALTLHAAPDWSSAHWDDADGEVTAALLAAAGDHLGGAVAREVAVARWRYATPVTAHERRCLVAVDGPAPVVCAGDAFGEAKVEGAVRSGWAAADALIERLGLGDAR